MVCVLEGWDPNIMLSSCGSDLCPLVFGDKLPTAVTTKQWRDANKAVFTKLAGRINKPISASSSTPIPQWLNNQPATKWRAYCSCSHTNQKYYKASLTNTSQIKYTAADVRLAHKNNPCCNTDNLYLSLCNFFGCVIQTQFTHINSYMILFGKNSDGSSGNEY